MFTSIQMCGTDLDVDADVIKEERRGDQQFHKQGMALFTHIQAMRTLISWPE